MTRTIPSQFLYELGTDFTKTTNVIPEPPSVIPAQLVLDSDWGAGIHCSAPQFTQGQLVHHDSFGLGTVKEFIDMGENSVIVVKFNTGQTKTLMLKYAGLAKV